MSSQRSKTPYNLAGFAIGMCFGVPYGIAIRNLPIGIAVGAAFGLSLSLAFNSTKEKEADPRTVNIGWALLMFGVVALIILFLVRYF